MEQVQSVEYLKQRKTEMELVIRAAVDNFISQTRMFPTIEIRPFIEQLSGLGNTFNYGIKTTIELV